MIISELVSLLGFKLDASGAQRFDAIMGRLQSNASHAAANIENVFQIASVGIAAALGGAALALGRPVALAGDAMNNSIAKIESSIGRSATSADEAAGLYDKLYEVGQRTGVGADESASAFTRFNLAMQDLNRPAEDTIKLIEGIQSAGIIAGTSTAELSSTMLQLGQALGSGKLQGEELNALRENMPRFLRDVMREVNMTSAEFFKAAEKGELNPALLVPAMLKASETARRELANFPLTMARSFSILKNAAQRFLAELDKQLNLSKTVAQVFAWIARTLDSWRSGLSVVGDLVRLLGGLEGIARLVGIALAVAFGPTLLRTIWALNGAFMVLVRQILMALLPLAGLVAWTIIIEDFIGWVQGRRSLFGERFGNFDEVIAPVRAQIEAFRAWFAQLPEAIATAWRNLVEGMRPQVEWLIGAARFIMDAFRPLTEFFEDIFRRIVARFVAFYERVASVINGIRSLIPGMAAATEGTGTGATSEPAGQEERRRNMGRRGALGGFPTIEELAAAPPDVSGRMGGGGATVNAPTSNVVTNQITVNAPGSDPASVARGAQAGVGRATEAMTQRLGSGLALGLGIANPRVEAAAQ